jgi:hypothetical protein
MLKLSNKQFCYWLQGFFEISEENLITKEQIILINNKLQMINEKYGQYTRWLKEVIELTLKHGATKDQIGFFNNSIRDNLNKVFMHVIDNSYETKIDQETLQNIHDGKIKTAGENNDK